MQEQDSRQRLVRWIAEQPPVRGVGEAGGGVLEVWVQPSIQSTEMERIRSGADPVEVRFVVVEDEFRAYTPTSSGAD